MTELDIVHPCGNCIFIVQRCDIMYPHSTMVKVSQCAARLLCSQVNMGCNMTELDIVHPCGTYQRNNAQHSGAYSASTRA